MNTPPDKDDLLEVLQDAPAADLTALKTASIIKHGGYRITGFVVRHPEWENRGIIEMSACRWLTKDEMWWLMHVSEELPKANTEDGI